MEPAGSKAPQKHNFLRRARIPYAVLRIAGYEENMARLARMLDTLDLHYTFAFQHVVELSLLVAMKSEEGFLIRPPCRKFGQAQSELGGRSVRRIEDLAPATCSMNLIIIEFRGERVDISAREHYR